jgi:hypothetical protein
MTKLPNPDFVHQMINQKDAEYETFFTELRRIMSDASEMRCAFNGVCYVFSIEQNISDFNRRLVIQALKDSGWSVNECVRKAYGPTEYGIYFDIKRPQ